MDKLPYGKKRLFGILSWAIVGIYIFLNLGMMAQGAPMQVMLITMPIVNIILIIAWFGVRALYNNANAKIKHAKEVELRPAVRRTPYYGQGNGEDYVPDVKIRSELFDSISTESDKGILFDMTLKDYLKPGKVITFHNEIDYGVFKRVKVSSVNVGEREIEARFTSEDEYMPS